MPLMKRRLTGGWTDPEPDTPPPGLTITVKTPRRRAEPVANPGVAVSGEPPMDRSRQGITMGGRGF